MLPETVVNNTLNSLRKTESAMVAAAYDPSFASPKLGRALGRAEGMWYGRRCTAVAAVATAG